MGKKNKKDSSGILFIIFCIFAIVYLKYFNPKIQPLQQPPKPTFDDAIDGESAISTNNYANATLYYYYYIPKKIWDNKKVQYPYLILLPECGGDGKDFTTNIFKDFAKKENFVIIAPSFHFDEENLHAHKSYQYPAAWSGAAFNNILINFQERFKIYPTTLYMLGISGGAQFVSRYSLLYPNYVKACAFNAPGYTDDPIQYQSTKFYVAIGTMDENFRLDTAKRFYELALKQRIDVTYKEYKIGHQLSQEEINDELNFFRTIKNNTQ